MIFENTDLGWLLEQAIAFIVPLATAAIALVIAVWGYRDGLSKQAKDYQHQFQIRTYERFLEPIENLLKDASAFNSYLVGFSNNASSDYASALENRRPLDWGRRPEDYMEKKTNYLKSISTVIKEIESIRIIEPKIDIFRTALASIHHDVSELYYNNSDYFYKYSTKEMLDNKGEKIKIGPEKLTKIELEHIENFTATISDFIIVGLSYLDDLKVELQNLLLGEIYKKNKVSYRKPIDPKKVVIRIDDYENLKEHFRKNTDMGKMQEELNAQLIEQYKNGK